MATIEQEIRFMDSERFESFVYNVLVERHPGAGIKRVRGAGGDEGIDLFQGRLDLSPTVWQCKHFSNKFGPAQKRNIVDSVKTAFENRDLKRWVLCVPMDFRVGDHTWFEREVVAKYSDRASVELMQGSELAACASSSRRLCLNFFPDLGIANLLRLEDTTQGEPNSTEARDKLQRAVEQFLSRELYADPRLSAVITVSSELGLTIPPLPASLFTLQQGKTALHLMPKDIEALRSDPITFNYTLAAEYKDAVELALDTGNPISVPAGFVLGISSSSPLIQSLLPASVDGAFLEIKALPPPNAVRDLYLRVTAGRGKTKQEIPFIALSAVRFGRKEVAYDGDWEALKVSAVISAQTQTMNLIFRSNFIGRDVRSIERSLAFMYQFEESKRLEIFNFQRSEQFYTQRISNMPRIDDRFGISEHTKKLITDSLLVAAHFKIPVLMPGSFGDSDARNILIMASILRQDQRANNINLSTKLVKRADLIPLVRRLGLVPHLEVEMFQKFGEGSEISGKKLRTEPILFHSTRARIQDPEDFLQRLLAAEDGEDVQILLECDECRFNFGVMRDKSALTITGGGETVVVDLVDSRYRDNDSGSTCG